MAASPLGLPCVTFLGQEAGAAGRPQGPSEPGRTAAPAQRRHAARTRTQLAARSAPAPPAPAVSCSSTAYGSCEGTTRLEKRPQNHNYQSAAKPRRRKDMRRHSFLIGSSLCQGRCLGNSGLPVKDVRGLGAGHTHTGSRSSPPPSRPAPQPGGLLRLSPGATCLQPGCLGLPPCGDIRPV